MFNGHMDTSYSGQEPWLTGIRGFQPEGFVQDGRIYGLGISNMKGALACYMEAVRALQDAGVRLKGDVMIACVVRRDRKDTVASGLRRERNTEATPPARASSHARRRHRHVHSRRADRAEDRARPLRRDLDADLDAAGRSSTPRSAKGGATRRRSCGCATCSTPCSSSHREWRSEPRTAASRGSSTSARSTAASPGAFPARRIGPTSSSTSASHRRCRWRRHVLQWATSCAACVSASSTMGSSQEVYVTAPGSEIAEDHPLVGAIDAGAQRGLRRETRARHGALVLGRVRADALRDRERQLRHVERPPRSGARREPRDRRSRRRWQRSTLVAQRVCGAA